MELLKLKTKISRAVKEGVGLVGGAKKFIA